MHVPVEVFNGLACRNILNFVRTSPFVQTFKQKRYRHADSMQSHSNSFFIQRKERTLMMKPVKFYSSV
jgi:hypothetical protein